MTTIVKGSSDKSMAHAINDLNARLSKMVLNPMYPPSAPTMGYFANWFYVAITVVTA